MATSVNVFVPLSFTLSGGALPDGHKYVMAIEYSAYSVEFSRIYRRQFRADIESSINLYNAELHSEYYLKYIAAYAYIDIDNGIIQIIPAMPFIDNYIVTSGYRSVALFAKIFTENINAVSQHGVRPFMPGFYRVLEAEYLFIFPPLRQIVGSIMQRGKYL